MLGMKLDPLSHDITIEDGQWARNKDAYNTAQNVKTRLLLFRGELIYNLNAGVPYYEDILGYSPSLPQIETILLSTIRETEGVNDVGKFEITLNKSTRLLSVSFIANTIYGDITEEEMQLVSGVTVRV